MEITVGHIVDNPSFDCNCDIVVRDGLSGETLFYRTDLEPDRPVPAEILAMQVTHIKTDNDALVIDAKTWED